MQILPAIDIKDGQAVRLFKGDFNQQTVVNPDVIEQAKTFKDAGIQFIHVVDLDGALDGRATNRDLIAEVKKVSGLGIEVGGGIRTLEQIRDYLEVGIDRIIIGSMAVKNPDFVRAALEEFGADKIVVGIDAKAGFVATEGWLETSNVDYITLAKEMEKMGVTLFVYTDVDRPLLDFCAVSIAADIVPVVDENRILAFHRVEYILELVHLEDKAKCYPDTLSGGEHKG